MDLALITRVIWRFRVLLIGGVALAAVLAAATVYKPTFSGGSPKLEHRQDEMWVSYGRLLVTQAGFPQGRSDIGDVMGGAQDPEAPRAQQFADPQRFVDMAILYARLATTEPVRRLMITGGPIEGADSVVVTAQEALPLIEVSATATSRESAIELAKRQVDALETFIGREQQDSGIRPGNRIGVKLVETPGAPAQLAEQANTWIIAPRSPIKPALVFLIVCGLFFALAMVLENANPRLRAVRSEPFPADFTIPEDELEHVPAKSA